MEPESLLIGNILLGDDDQAPYLRPEPVSRPTSAPPSYRSLVPNAAEPAQEPSELYRSDPQYLEYYYSHKALNPR